MTYAKVNAACSSVPLDPPVGREGWDDDGVPTNLMAVSDDGAQVSLGATDQKMKIYEEHVCRDEQNKICVECPTSRVNISLRFLIFTVRRTIGKKEPNKWKNKIGEGT